MINMIMIHKHLSIQWVLDGSTDADVEPKQLIREEKMSFFILFGVLSFCKTLLLTVTFTYMILVTFSTCSHLLLLYSFYGQNYCLIFTWDIQLQLLVLEWNWLIWALTSPTCPGFRGLHQIWSRWFHVCFFLRRRLVLWEKVKRSQHRNFLLTGKSLLNFVFK